MEKSLTKAKIIKYVTDTFQLIQKVPSTTDIVKNVLGINPPLSIMPVANSAPRLFRK